jgi:hypothetical protein
MTCLARQCLLLLLLLLLSKGVSTPVAATTLTMAAVLSGLSVARGDCAAPVFIVVAAFPMFLAKS